MDIAGTISLVAKEDFDINRVLHSKCFQKHLNEEPNVVNFEGLQRNLSTIEGLCDEQM